MAQLLILAAVAVLAYFIVKYAYQTDTPKIKGIPEVPGLPFFGSLFALGTDHPRKTAEWSKTYGPVFQVRIGRKRIVFATTFDSIRELWTNQQAAMSSRPTLYTFHSVVSSSATLTIGTSPWDASCRARRKAIATALSKPNVQRYMPIIDMESSSSIRDLLHDSNYGEKDLNPIAYFARYALNTSLVLNYGFRIEGTADSGLLKEIVDVERIQSNLRSTSNNMQDYLPFLRPFATTNHEAIDARKRRDAYHAHLLGKLKDNIEKGVDKPCITGSILKDPEARLSDDEIKSVCLTMVGAGIDTIASNLIMGIAQLSSPEGQQIQKKAYADIIAAHPEGDAWEACLRSEKVPYITAFVKEILRFFTVVPMSLPRSNIKEVTYQGVTIPANTTFHMNSWAADYDTSRFDQPEKFMVERYLGEKESAIGTDHHGFGAGSRACIGNHLANRELYTAFVRLICAFEILPPQKQEDRPILDALDCNRYPTSLTTDPKDFKVGFRVRDRALLERWLEDSEESTRHL